MKRISRIVQSTDGTTVYSVEFEFGTHIRVTCNCKAALNTMLCRHREDFFRSRELSTFDPPMPGDDLDLYQSIAASWIPAAYLELHQELSRLAKEKKDIEQRTREAKSAFARRLAEGA